MVLVLRGTPSSLFFERLLYGKINNLTEFPVWVVMQSIELCKAVDMRASLCHGFMALKGSRALHNYSVLRNCNNSSGAR